MDNNNSTVNKFPQTGNRSAFWATGLGMFLLTITGVFGFKRRKE